MNKRFKEYFRFNNFIGIMNNSMNWWVKRNKKKESFLVFSLLKGVCILMEYLLRWELKSKKINRKTDWIEIFRLYISFIVLCNI